MSHLNKIHNKLMTLCVLSLSFFLLTTIIPNVFAADYNGGNYVEFVSSVDNGDGTSTWMYNVIMGGTCHWVVSWCGGEASVLDWGIVDHAKPSMNYGTYNGIRGIRFSYPHGSGVITYWFVLNGVYAEGDVEAVVQGHGPAHYGTVIGPVFSYGLTLTVEGEGPDSTYMKAVAETDYALVNTVTFNWYGPFESDSEAGPVGSPVYVDVDSDGSDGFEAQHQLTEDDLGYWYVKAEFEGGFHPGEASGILSLAEVFPWFTDLPLALLATVGAVFILKKKGHMGPSI